MTNDKDNAVHTKSLMMAFGHTRHKRIVFARDTHTPPSHSPTYTSACTLNTHPADSYSLFMGFKLDYQDINLLVQNKIITR